MLAKGRLCRLAPSRALVAGLCDAQLLGQSEHMMEGVLQLNHRNVWCLIRNTECRRNYHGLFEAVANSHELTTSPHFTLRLIGKGALEIPAALQGKVVKETDLAYEVWHSEELAKAINADTLSIQSHAS